MWIAKFFFSIFFPYFFPYFFHISQGNLDKRGASDGAWKGNVLPM